QLAAWGYDVHPKIGGTGVVGQLQNGTSNKKIGLRADMDCLPIQEETKLPYASQIPGCMHACGHDGHMTVLLTAARYLATKKNFNGTLNVIFQPGEEGLHGAPKMIADGLFDKFPCDQIFGFHNWPNLKNNNIYLQPGVIM
ncbi:M20/M25/M40 family metallo-hydrolase, partial [Lactobacillus sp. XV13L]|nr:M20/M25/M40 family metallo-hydrolase [Lactobacillus sp. XV13L]